MLHWLWTAIDTYLGHPLTGAGYQWWSGAGSDLGELALVGGVIAAYRHINCQAPRCWRRGPHKTADGHHLCRRHHPDLPNHRLSLHEIHLRHHQAKEQA